MSEENQYDVAFSFLQRDEQLALETADRIRDRVNVFIYSEQQKELIANDGVNAFSETFKQRARVVVILFRDAWGSTKWTRIEETAIKSRHLDEGPKFLVVASLDGKHPVWYPDTWIWGDLERYGIDGLASVIETKVRQRGGEVRAQTLEDYAAAVERDMTFASDRRSWRNSEKGIQDALAEVGNLLEFLQRACEKLSGSGNWQTELKFRRDSHRFAEVSGWNIRFSISWGHTYGNTLDMSGLHIIMTEGGRFYGNQVIVEPTKIAVEDYDLDCDRSRRIGWRAHSGKKAFHTSQQLADQWIRQLLDYIRKRAVGNSEQ